MVPAISVVEEEVLQVGHEGVVLVAGEAKGAGGQAQGREQDQEEIHGVKYY